MSRLASPVDPIFFWLYRVIDIPLNTWVLSYLNMVGDNTNLRASFYSSRNRGQLISTSW